MRQAALRRLELANRRAISLVKVREGRKISREKVCLLLGGWRIKPHITGIPNKAGATAAGSDQKSKGTGDP